MNHYNIELNNLKITQLGIQAISDFYRTMAIADLEKLNLLAIATGDNSAFLNVVIDTRQQKENSSEYVTEFYDFFKQHNVHWSWMVTNNDQQHDLEQCGLVLLETAPSMYFDLRPDLPTENIANLIIKQIDERDDLSTWIKPLQEGFPSKDNGEYFRQLNAKLLNQGEKKLRHYLGYYRNEAVVAGTLFLGDNAVMLHNIATKITFQKRGFGTAFTLHLMNEAKKLGYANCYLDSSEDGFGIYQKLGFKIYSLLSFYQIKV